MTVSSSRLGRTFRDTNVQLNCLSGVRIGATNES